jgi:hypothetical protein
MKKTRPFRFPRAFGGEILAQYATFLPVATGWLGADGEIYAAERPPLAGFLPILEFNRKNLTVAQPLLKEVCDEMR